MFVGLLVCLSVSLRSSGDSVSCITLKVSREIRERNRRSPMLFVEHRSKVKVKVAKKVKITFLAITSEQS